MNKDTFLCYIDDLQEYADKISIMDDTMNVDLMESFVGNMFDQIGDMVIKSINSTLDETNEDYFYSKFWNALWERKDDDFWCDFYDQLIRERN